MLGGMSWESTALYYRLANERVRERRGGLASAELVVRSVDFARIRRLQLEQRWDEAGRLLLAEARGLEAAGAELIVLCTNYMHKIAPVIEAGLQVPMLHIADVAAGAAIGCDARRVGLIGAAATMAEPFYVDRLSRHGLDVVVPDAAARERLDRAIFTELCRGVLSDATRQELRAVLARLVAAGAQAIILGCTELELLLGASDATVPLLPTARLHVDAALDLALDVPASVGPIR